MNTPTPVTFRELVIETAAYYTSKNRSSGSPAGAHCMYAHPLGAHCMYVHPLGMRCAFSRCCKQDEKTLALLADYERMSASAVLRKSQDIVLPRYRNITPEQWDEVQQLHDERTNWDEEGITSIGINRAIAAIFYLGSTCDPETFAKEIEAKREEMKNQPHQMKIDPSKKYTSGGHPVEFLHRAPEGYPDPYPWRGMVDGEEFTWTDEGYHIIGDPHPDLDLTEAVEPKTIWVNEYLHDQSYSYSTKEEAVGIADPCAVRTAVEYREVVSEHLRQSDVRHRHHHGNRVPCVTRRTGGGGMNAPQETARYFHSPRLGSFWRKKPGEPIEIHLCGEWAESCFGSIDELLEINDRRFNDVVEVSENDAPE
jgi:hypothetical protein